MRSTKARGGERRVRVCSKCGEGGKLYRLFNWPGSESPAPEGTARPAQEGRVLLCDRCSQDARSDAPQHLPFVQKLAQRPSRKRRRVHGAPPGAGGCSLKRLEEAVRAEYEQGAGSADEDSSTDADGAASPPPPPEGPDGEGSGTPRASDAAAGPSPPTVAKAKPRAAGDVGPGRALFPKDAPLPAPPRKRFEGPSPARPEAAAQPARGCSAVGKESDAAATVLAAGAVGRTALSPLTYSGRACGGGRCCEAARGHKVYCEEVRGGDMRGGNAFWDSRSRGRLRRSEGHSDGEQSSEGHSGEGHSKILQDDEGHSRVLQNGEGHSRILQNGEDNSRILQRDEGHSGLLQGEQGRSKILRSGTAPGDLGPTCSSFAGAVVNALYRGWPLDAAGESVWRPLLREGCCDAAEVTAAVDALAKATGRSISMRLERRGEAPWAEWLFVPVDYARIINLRGAVSFAITYGPGDALIWDTRFGRAVPLDELFLNECTARGVETVYRLSGRLGAAAPPAKPRSCAGGAGRSAAARSQAGGDVNPLPTLPLRY